MADVDSDPDEAMTRAEIQGEEAPPKSAVQNAFTKLMAPKPKPTSPSASVPRMSRPNPFKDRMGLGAYLDDPASFPPSVVVSHNDAFVAVRDKFPKATIHTLLLPRSPQHQLQHPFDALADLAFLEQVRAEAARLKTLVAAELERRMGPHSAADAARQAVLNGDAEPQGDDGALPAGRDWAAEVKVGVHAVPSMGHLHVHVLSRDMHSPALRHRKHYNSFTTPFLVDLADFPLRDDDPRRHPGDMGYLRRDLVCWRCGRNFGNQFKRLKEHLEDEFEAWRKE